MILTIDVGLKNLAMCIMTCQNKNNTETYSIKFWEVFNTLEDDEILENSRCEFPTKSGRICGKNCSMKYLNTLDKQTLDKQTLDKQTLDKQTLDKQTLDKQTLDKQTLDKQISNEYIYCCKAHFPNKKDMTKKNEIRRKKVNDYLLQDICKIILTKIPEIYNKNIDYFSKLEKIFIELQPKCNAKMKLISHLIYGKFVELYMDKNIPIRFVRASQKLKAYKGPLINCILKGSYAKRKYLSVEYTKWFLDNCFDKTNGIQYKEKFLSHSKKDDLGDVFLMAINAIKK